MHFGQIQISHRYSLNLDLEAVDEQWSGCDNASAHLYGVCGPIGVELIGPYLGNGSAHVWNVWAYADISLSIHLG
jgi:hypothetical protein